MAGGRKGHELSSARHPTISIYTRPRLSAHPSEGAEGTAEICVLEERRDARGRRARGRGGRRKRQTEWKLVCLEKKKNKKKKKKGGNSSGSLKEMRRKQTNGRRGKETKKANLTERSSY